MNIIENWSDEGSDWEVERVENPYVIISKHQPSRGLSYIELPTEQTNSAKRLINLKNDDDECFSLVSC